MTLVQSETFNSGAKTTGHEDFFDTTHVNFALQIIGFIYLSALSEFRPFPFFPHAYTGLVVDEYASLLFYFRLACDAIFILIQIVLLLSSNDYQKLIRMSPIGVAFFVFPVFHSILFSVVPVKSVIATVDYLGIFAFCSTLVSIYGPVACINMLRIFAAIVAFLNLVSLLVPSTSFMIGDHIGRFRGFFAHKNSLGFNCALLLVIVFGFSGYLTKKQMSFGIFNFAVAMIFIISIFAAQQAAAYVVLLVIATIVTATFIFRIVGKPQGICFLVLVFSLVFICFAFQVFDFDSALGLLGRDSTLTGRIAIWANYMQIGSQNPILGIGFRSAFLDPHYAVMAIANGLDFKFGTMHSSYLETFVSYGILGCALLFFFIIDFFKALLSVSKQNPWLTWIGFIVGTSALLGGIQGTLELMYPGFSLTIIAFLYFSAKNLMLQPKLKTLKYSKYGHHFSLN